ncbi:hypothetical protein VT84_34210 [Gemmata sp. SH-PL17]|nr:hypothetical protein VT84_34210 [Gemmata sp. SH-PL17]
MSILTRKVDDRSRVVLPDEFSGKLVTLEEVTKDHVIIKIVKPIRKRPSLTSLLARMTDTNQQPPVELGPPIGNEEL